MTLDKIANNQAKKEERERTMKSRPHMNGYCHRTIIVMIVLITLLGLGVNGCSQQSAEKAGEGAVMGGAVGAVGGFVTSLVFGGNPMEGAARGAVYGASTGATAGAIAGSQQEKAQKQQQSVETEKIRKKIGDDAFNGAVALIQCKREVAIANARIAAKDKDEDKALAGLWIEALTYADNKEEDKAREMFPQIVEKDGKIDTNEQAEDRMRQGLQRLGDIREKHALPRVCP
jgi:hypothetical protein